ncbi:MAG: HAMP domain-containing histidine kinase, partial [Kordiimonadaceae bacterium]|nr:HAMP domain-containing histidine kinase [Kordiimonadaceae bacterium]
LRTPLNAIIGFAQAFEQQTFGSLENRYIGYAEDIRKSGEHLLGLINDILDVAVIESGGLSLQVDEISLEQTLNKAVHMNADAACKKSINIDALSFEISHHVRADDRRLTQVLVNLLSNAVKFTPEGGSIGAEVEKHDADGMIAVTIWDTGIGISEENITNVFDKFQQVTEHIYSRSQEGTGLGLHISRELARKMGGDITVVSEENKGSRFTVTVPIADGAPLDDNFI